MVLWVIPNTDVASILQSEIDKLAELYQAKPFLPHITAARLPVKTPGETIKALDVIAQKIDTLSISFGEVRLSSNPYQKMVINLDDSPFFSELSQAVDSVFQEPCSKNEFHCSLLYGYTPNHLLESDKSKIFDRLPGKGLAHELAVVLLNGGPEEWRIIHRKKLME